MGDKPVYSLAQLAQYLNAELHGDPGYEIKALATLQQAGANELSFIANPAYQKYLATTRAGALLLRAEFASQYSGAQLRVANPYLAYAKLSALFDPQAILPAASAPAIHPSVVMGENCQLGQGVNLAANVVLGHNVVLGDGVRLGAGSVIGDDCQLGARTRVAANVTLYQGVSLGEDCIVHAGCVLGADGFGFAPSPEGWVKIHQLGGVVIGNRVEIGASTCIDRGALDDTRIEDGVIIDNLVQIAHNVQIGKNTAIAGHTAIAGSTHIGANCTIAGAVGIVGHLQITDGVHITAMTLVTHSIDKPGSYSSGTPMSQTREWRKNAARFRQLDNLAGRLIHIERGKSAT